MKTPSHPLRTPPLSFPFNPINALPKTAHARMKICKPIIHRNPCTSPCSAMPHAACHMIDDLLNLQSLGRKPKLRSPRRVVEDHELRLEEDIAEDGLSDAIVALETTEAASTLRCGCVVQVATGDDGRVAFDLESEVGKAGAAGEDVATVRLAVGGSGDLTVVGGDEVIGEEEEGSSGVGDGGDALGDRASGTNGVAAGGEAPESLGVVDSRVGDVSSVLAGVDVAEVVATGLALLQVGGEERGFEAGLGVGEEGLLLVRGDRVDGAEGQAQETIALILSEFRADGFGQFDGLAGDRCTADVDDVGVNVAAG